MFALNAYDDYPYHQHAAPVDIPATSDSHFNDGYWWSWYRDDTYFFCGLRLHPNNNVMDGYAGAVHGGVQRNVRVSRVLRPRHGELSVGPLGVRIVEPMRVQRLTLAPNPSGVEFDVEATASAPMFLEAPHVQYRFGRAINNLLRYSGTTRVGGTASVDGEQLPVERWYGARDHSWGIRSSMGPYVPIGGLPSAADGDPRAIRIWIPFEAQDHAGFFHLHEDATGRVLDFEGRLFSPAGDAEPLASARHRFRYHPGTRRLAGGEFTLCRHDGGSADYAFEVVGHPAHPQGFGYTRGWSDGGNPGVYRGPEYAEADRFDVTDPAGLAGPEYIPPARRLGGTEFAAELVGPGGRRGMAHVEHMIYGRYEPYGFADS